MAYIGLRHPVFAPLKTEVDGSAPTYDAGVVIGKVQNCNVEFNRSDAKMHGDDVEIESDNSITGGTIALGVDNLTDAVQTTMFDVSEGSGDGVYVEGGESSPYGGFGYMRVKQLRGVVSYVGYWVYKVKFSLGGEDASTKAENVEFQGVTINGSLAGVYPDSTLKAKFREHKSFDTAAACIAWLDGKAGITG